MKRLRNVIGPCAALLTACAAPDARANTQAESVDVDLPSLGLTDAPTLRVGDRAAAVVRLNVPLVRRVVLAADDLQEVELRLTCRPAATEIERLAAGTGLHGGVTNLASVKALQRIEMESGETLAITVWKPGWHYHAGATGTGLAVRRLDERPAAGKAAVFPAGARHGRATTNALGRLELAGLGGRDTFCRDVRWLTLAGRTAVEPESQLGCWSVPGSRGSGIRVNDDGTIRFHTNGRAKHGPEYDWAPAVLFTAAQPGAYAIEGSLAFGSGRAEDEVAWMVGRLHDAGETAAGTTLSLHRVLRPFEGSPISGRDYEAVPVAAGTIRRKQGEVVVFTNGITGLLREALTSGRTEEALLLKATQAGGRPLRLSVAGDIPGHGRVRQHPKHVLFDYDIRPQAGVYATNRNGKLCYGDRRLRLWGMVKDAPAERVRSLGFNCVRMWFQSDFYDASSARRGEAFAAVAGDGSKLDVFDRLMADLKREGVFVMLATTVGQGMPMEPLLADDSWVAGGDDWEDWKAAVRQAGDETYRLAYVDDRLWQIRLRHARNVLDHRNVYTGRRYAEEEIIALIEVNNEAGVIRRWLETGFAGWPAYFRDRLQQRWNQWLLTRHAGDDGLKAAWGQLAAGESAAAGTVALSPLLAERASFPRARQEDLVRFLCGLIDSRNQEYRDACRSLAPPGVGAASVPFSFDSQYRPSIPWLYSNSLGDSSTVSMYFWSNGSMLLEPPSLYVLDSHRLQNKLAVIYETQRSRPSPFRAEYPYMLAAMTCWQDFDVVVWHGNWIGTRTGEQLLAGTVPPTTVSHYWTGVHLEHDPVMSAAVALAGRLFLRGHLPTAPDPVVHSVGEDAIFSYDTWNGIGGARMSRDTFGRGSRIALKPESAGGVAADGHAVAALPAPQGAVATGTNVLWDWPNGRLIIDAPSAKVYVGRTAPFHRFRDGITLSGFDTPFVSFALISADGRPLTGAGACTQAWISAVADCRNTGFETDLSVPGGPIEQARAVRRAGHAPVVVDPVSCTVSFPQQVEGLVETFDFAMRATGRTTLDGHVLRRPGQTDWMTRLTWDRRGDPAPEAIDPSPGAPAAPSAGTGDAGEQSDPALASMPHPIPGLSWGDNFLRGQRVLRDASFTRTAVRVEEPPAAPAQRMFIVEAPIVLDLPVDAELVFRDGRMESVNVTFRQPPSFAALVGRLEQQHGRPVRRTQAAEAFGESRVEWRIEQPRAVLRITATEAQGVVRLDYVLQKAH